jgi:hypothetical protein
MLLIYLILAFSLVFLSGCHWTIWKIDNKKSALYWSIGLSSVGLYILISMIGRASSI